MIIKRTRTFAVPPTGFIGTANKLAARSSGQAASKLAATSKFAAPPIGKPLSAASLKTTGLGSINTAAKQATPPSKAVNMAKSTFTPSVTAKPATTAKPIVGFNAATTFV